MSRPIHVEESVTVARSPEAVWSVVADYGTDVQWRKGLTDMTPDPPGPPAVGTKVHEVLKTGGRSDGPIPRSLRSVRRRIDSRDPGLSASWRGVVPS
jgi:Polyketide cyclase / dehydrase and lipid transport